MARMHRTQIYLPDELAEALDELASQRGTSRADLLRQAARRFIDATAEIRPFGDDPMDRLIGIADGDGPSDLAAEHDRYLLPPEKDRWKR